MNPLWIATENPFLMILLKIESNISSVLKNMKWPAKTKLNWKEGKNSVKPLIKFNVDSPTISEGRCNIFIPTSELPVFEEAVQMAPGIKILEVKNECGTFTNVVIWFDSPSSIYWLSTNKILIDHFNPKS